MPQLVPAAQREKPPLPAPARHLQFVALEADVLNFDWMRILKAREEFERILFDLHDAIHQNSDLVSPVLVDLVLDMPLGPDDAYRLGDWDALVFQAAFHLQKSLQGIEKAADASERLEAIAELERSGGAPRPGERAWGAP